MNEPDWITYIPRRVYDAASRMEAACKRIDFPSPIAVAEERMRCREAMSERVLWHQVWRYLMEKDCVIPDYDIRFVVVDDPDFDCIHSVAPYRMH